MPKHYNAVIGGGQDCQEVILIVCPQSHDQQGRKMFSTLDAVKSRFSLSRVFLADTLSIHNGMSHRAARLSGNDWLERHGSALDGTQIIRWDQLRADTSFSHRYTEITRLYNEEASASSAVDDICRRHAAVIMTRKQRVDHNVVFKQSISYMLEEIAGLTLIRSKTLAPEVYPGEYFSDPALFDGLSPVSLRLPDVLPVRFEARSLSINL